MKNRIEALNKIIDYLENDAKEFCDVPFTGKDLEEHLRNQVVAIYELAKIVKSIIEEGVNK